MQGHPAGLTSHDLQNHHALVAGRRCVQAIQRIGHAGNRGVKTKCHRGGLEVVVDRFGNSDDMKSFFVKLQCRGERTVASDDDEGMEAKCVVGLPCLNQDFRRDRDRIACSDFCHKVALVHRSQNRSAEMHDPGSRPAIKQDMVTRRKETFKSIPETDEFPAQFIRGTARPAKDGIESGTVAPAGQNSDAFFFHQRLQSDWDLGVFLPLAAQAS